MKPQPITARAPGKLILSGEHAILHGAPVLATSVNLYATTTLTPYSLSDIGFELINLDHKRDRTRLALSRLKARLQKDYQRFKQGEVSIRGVLKKPFELVEYTVSHFLDRLDRFDEKRKAGVHIHHHSEIPTGCGMGSSAASIISTNLALNQFYQKNLSLDTILALSLEAENLQHGYSSGIDLFMATYGGTWLIEGTQRTPLTLPSELPLFWANTGAPLSSTGECVSVSREYFAKHPEKISEFRAVTHQMAEAFKQKDLNSMKAMISANQELLNQLGVTPVKIQKFFTTLHEQGLAGKICGAGSVSGDSAGIILLCGDPSTLQALCKQEGFVLHPLHSAKAASTM